MTSGIYCIENKIDGKVYIGQAKDFDKRIYHHRWNWKKENYGETSGENRPLWNAIKKYGEENFDVFMIEECRKEELNFLETFYIKSFNGLISEKGYNILSDGFSRKGIPHSQETKNKISSANKGKTRTQETREKMSKARMGFKPSPETVEKTASSKRGKKLTKEHIEKVKKGLTGIKMKNASSKYIGVSFDKSRNKWSSTILEVNGKRKNLGRYDSEMQAAKIFNAYVLKNSLNNPINKFSDSEEKCQGTPLEK